jgi:hypothetical protein
MSPIGEAFALVRLGWSVFCAAVAWLVLAALLDFVSADVVIGIIVVGGITLGSLAFVSDQGGPPRRL